MNIINSGRRVDKMYTEFNFIIKTFLFSYSIFMCAYVARKVVSTKIDGGIQLVSTKTDNVSLGANEALREA